MPGIVDAKASLVSAALEFSRRRLIPARRKIGSLVDVLPLVHHLTDRSQEQFVVHSLTGAHKAI